MTAPGDNPYQAPRGSGGKRGPGVLAPVLIVLASYAAASLVAPADPFSIGMGLGVLLPLTLGSYFAGYVRGKAVARDTA